MLLDSVELLNATTKSAVTAPLPFAASRKPIWQLWPPSKSMGQSSDTRAIVGELLPPKTMPRPLAVFVPMLVSVTCTVDELVPTATRPKLTEPGAMTSSAGAKPTPVNRAVALAPWSVVTVRVAA